MSNVPSWIVVGTWVRTKSTVLPEKFAERTGPITEVRRVTPAEVPEVHEISLNLGGKTVWFDPRELEETSA
jgi:hypothetical protein